MSVVLEMRGAWKFLPEKSTEIGRFGASRLEFDVIDDVVTIQRTLGHFKMIESMICRTDGSALTHTPAHRIIPEAFLSGIYRDLDTDFTLTGTLLPEGGLKITEDCIFVTSQGKSPAEITHTFELEEDGEVLRHTIRRSTRVKPDDTVYSYAFQREDIQYAYSMELGENWEINGDLPEHALLVSLQGVVNKKGPRLYFVYPGIWDFKFTPAVFEFLSEKKGFCFSRLTGIEQAVRVFRNDIRGYVVWDTKIRTSLIVAFTIAGLENAVVVSEDEVELMTKAGIPLVADLRDRFEGKPDVEIYRWAYELYWDRCSRDYIVWLGGEHGKIMKPGVADWGMYKQAFFTDLSARESDKDEYALAGKLLGEQNPQSYVFGWHSYKKDTEDEHVTLTSSFGLRMEGLHSLPNMSFSSQIPVSKGFEFKNNHSVVPGEMIVPEEKVYVACVQTDCLGIGAWTEPGRGEIPYAWEVTMNWVWLAPAMMEFFYTQASPLDYFIGALSGPGYMYPSAIPRELLPGLIKDAAELMKKLDLNVFDIMDFSKLLAVRGTPDLTPDLVDAYYENMPDALGFINGYFPAHTFTVKEGRPFVSFDYYLSPTRPEKDATADIQELAAVNSKRPYFLLIHVRNFSDIRRVIRIVNDLPDGFEVIALDKFLTMAGENWTFGEWFADDDE
ncbi:MAG: hypothetical protein HN368_14920 [Spirochaetales bacterium]|jgi:hypothetical protein|nr:hypothetical protein [Spirochaetales bacterium]